MKYRKMKKNNSPVFVFIIKLVLGITFIYASYHKIADPGSFARILYGYGVFPGAAINILAIIVPFIELTAGMSLIFGLYTRSALLIINALLCAFIFIIGFNLLRGHSFDCGCFSFARHSNTLSNLDILIRDIFLLAAGIYMARHTKAS